MANVQVDYENADGTWTSTATDGAANAAATVTIAAPQAGGRARIHKVTASCSGATAGVDGTLIIKPDASTSSWKEVLGAVRGPMSDKNFNKPIICKAASTSTVVLSALGASAVGVVSVVYDYKY